MIDGDEKVGAGIVRRALEAPIRQISENAGQDGTVVVQNVRAGNTEGEVVGQETREVVESLQAAILVAAVLVPAVT